MQFVEANSWPNGLSLVSQALGFVVGTIIGSARDHFSSTYSPSTVQNFRQEAVLNAAQEQVSFLRTEYSAATQYKSTDSSRNRVINDLNRLVNDDGMAAVTSNMDKAINLTMNAISKELSGQDKFDAFRRIANNAANTSTFESPASDTENSVYSTIRVIAAAYMSEAALNQDNSRAGLIYERIDTISALLDNEAAMARDICANELFVEINKFKTESVAALYAKAYEAPGLISYNFSGRVHPVVAAYSVYGDAKKHRDLESNNVIGIAGRIGPAVLANRGLN